MVSSVLKQIWIVSGVLLNVVGLGMVLSYPSSLLPGLRAKDSDIQIDLESSSWISSSIGISSILGFFISSALMQNIGRRWNHVTLVLPTILGWILIYFSTNVPMLITGRALQGFGGANLYLGAIVIGEYTSPKNRGLFLTLKTTATNIGVISMHVLANYLHWRTVALCGLVPTITAFGIVCTWPESPAYLITKKKLVESEKIFYWLRGNHESASKEFAALVQGQINDITNAKERSRAGFITKCFAKDIVKPVLIMTAGMVLVEACGRHTFPAYAGDMIGGMTGDKAESFIYTLSIDIINAGSAVFSCVLVKMMKRRTLLFLSGISATIVLCSISLYLYVKGAGSYDKPWIPLSMLVLYFILTNLGCITIPVALTGELFPLRHMGAGSALSGLIMSLAVFVALKATPAMLVNLKIHGTFAVYAAVMFVSLLYMYFALPETKDRTLQEIEDFFHHGRFLDEQKSNKKKLLNEEVTNVEKF